MINSSAQSQAVENDEESNPIPDSSSECSENFLQEFFKTGTLHFIKYQPK